MQLLCFLLVRIDAQPEIVIDFLLDMRSLLIPDLLKRNLLLLIFLNLLILRLDLILQYISSMLSRDAFLLALQIHDNFLVHLDLLVDVF